MLSFETIATRDPFLIFMIALVIWWVIEEVRNGN